MITMNETLILMGACVVGIILGAIFFGGLWWSIRKGVSSKRPALWFFGSFLLRMSIALTGFYFVSLGHWERLIACVLGFFTARFIVKWLIGPPLEHHSSPEKEAPHAP